MAGYDLELDDIIAHIKKRGHKRIMLQLPDGLKPDAQQIAGSLTQSTGVDVLIWMGSCFGGCDIPQGIDNLNVDMLVQWGHNRFQRSEGW